MTPIVRHRNWLICLALIAAVLVTFDDVVFKNLNLAFGGLDTGVPNDDARVLLYPFFDRFLDSVHEKGKVDPWNPYIWGGMPAIGNPNVPFNVLLFGLFHLGKPAFLAAMNWHLVAEFCLAAVGMFLFTLELGLGSAIAALAAVLYAQSASAAWLTNSYCLFFHWAVLPWALLILLTASRRSAFRSTLYLGLLFYFQITYGQSQMTLYSALFLFLCAGWVFKERLGRPALRLLASGYAVGAALALHYLLPLVEFYTHSAVRASEGLAATAARFQVPFQYLINLFIPRLFWKPVPWWPVWTDGWSPWEAFHVSIGSLFGLLALYGLREFWKAPGDRPPFIRRLKLLGIALIVLNASSVGGWLLAALHLGAAVPYSRLTQLMLWPLLFAALAEIGPVLSSRRETGKFALFLVAGGFGLFLFTRGFSSFADGFFRAAVPFSRYTPESAPALAASLLRDHKEGLTAALLLTFRFLAASTGLFALAWLLHAKARARNVCAALALLLGVWDAVDFFRSHRQRGQEAFPFTESLRPDNPLLQALRARQADLQNYSFSTYTGWMEKETGLAPNLNALSKIRSVNGYTSFLPKRSSIEPEFYRGNWGYPFSEAVARLLSLRFILVGSKTPELGYGHPIAEYKDYKLLEYEGALPRHYFPPSLKLSGGRLYEAPTGCRFEFEREGEGTFALRNECAESVYFAFPRLPHHWWRVRLNGRAARWFSADPVRDAVEIPPGVHRLELVCLPYSWYLGLGLSLLTLFSLGLHAQRRLTLGHSSVLSPIPQT